MSKADGVLAPSWKAECFKLTNSVQVEELDDEESDGSE
jgi:hypothetical protein